MATQITVAVGANGEVLNAQALRDGARADRLDTEATTKQAKEAAIDKLDDDSTGRENKLSRYGVSRDPAAFARKKKEDGQFVGLNVFYTHFPLRGTWDSARDAAYMWLDVRGITEEGELKERQRIELTRNVNTEAFYLDAPSGYVNEQLLFSQVQSNRGFTDWPRYGTSLSEVWGLIGFNKYAVYTGATRNSDGWYWRGGTSGGFTGPVSPRVMPAIDSTTAFTIYEEVVTPYAGSDYPTNDLFNPNAGANGRTEADSTFTGYDDFHKDPVHELFMLPFNGKTSFVLVIFTDYMAVTRSWLRSSAKVESKFFADWPNEAPGGAKSSEVIYERYRPEYQVPDGYEFPDFDATSGQLLNDVTTPSPVITEDGANKIQTIKLYRLEDGELTEVEEIPQKLRDRAADLSANLKNYRVKSGYAPSREWASSRLQSYFGSRGLEVTTLDGPTNDNWTVIDQGCRIMGDKGLNDTVKEARKYLDDETRQRSICKGYGIGMLSTDNHFDSPYIRSESKCFWDDKYFTPMVYSYLSGSARPGMTYAQAAEARPIDPVTDLPIELKTFVEHDGYDKIRFTETPPTAINVPAEGSFTAWQKVPQFEYSTHQSWNWGRPDLCWEELNKLGFDRDLIGSRPPKP